MATLTRKQISISGLVLVLLIIYPWFFKGSFPLHVMIMVFMYAMMGVAWNIMGGYAGMFSFGQAAFFGIGAYTSSYLLITYHVSPWIGLLAGGVLAAVAAAAIGIPCSNLRGHYFAIASIAFAEIVRTHFNNWKLVGAAEGLTLPILDQSLKHFEFHSSKVPYYYILLGFLLLSLFVCSWVSTSRMGFYFRAIKESHELAKVVGINFVRYRLAAIMISAFLTAIAGTFYAQYILYIDPDSVLVLAISVQVVLVSMLGGAGTLMGPVIGAAILLPISEGTRVWLGPKGTGIDMVVYGTLIMGISAYQPQGVWGVLSRIGARRTPAIPSNVSAPPSTDLHAAAAGFGRDTQPPGALGRGVDEGKR